MPDRIRQYMSEKGRKPGGNEVLSPYCIYIVGIVGWQRKDSFSHVGKIPDSLDQVFKPVRSSGAARVPGLEHR